jgi:hypothetical protein
LDNLLLSGSLRAPPYQKQNAAWRFRLDIRSEESPRYERTRGCPVLNKSFFRYNIPDKSVYNRRWQII